MLACPECLVELVYAPTDRGYVWQCEQCGGCVSNLAALRERAGPQYVERLTRLAREGGASWKRPCPMCSNYLTELDAALEGDALSLDVCTTCQSVWLGREARLRLLPSSSPGSPSAVPSEPVQATPAAATTTPSVPDRPSSLSQEQQERIAAFYAQTAANQFDRAQGEKKSYAPDTTWQKVLGSLGMPVKCDTFLSRTPITTWILAFFIAAVSLLALLATDMETTVGNLAFIPALPFRHYGLTLLTSILLHGGLLHLLSNLYFLVFFGDSVEDHIGGFGFILLFLGAAMVGNTVHAALDPHSEVPLIGASGGIAGLLTYYGLTFPRARVAFCFWLGLVYRFWIRVPALLFVLFWVAMQVLGARAQIAGFSDVSSLAHLGGAAVGLIFWLAWRLGDKAEGQKGSRGAQVKR